MPYGARSLICCLDMFQLKYKDMFAGEIYLEMTYFINVSLLCFSSPELSLKSNCRTHRRCRRRCQNP